MVATIAQLVEHVTRNDGVVGSNPTGGLSLASRGGERTNWDRVPRGVTGNTSDSGSEESWFDPRRGNSEGWPSGLRRRPAKALTRKGLVGSNPTPSARERGSPRRECYSNPGLRLRRLRLLTSPSGRLAPDLGCESQPRVVTTGVVRRPLFAPRVEPLDASRPRPAGAGLGCESHFVAERLALPVGHLVLGS